MIYQVKHGRAVVVIVALTSSLTRPRAFILSYASGCFPCFSNSPSGSGRGPFASGWNKDKIVAHAGTAAHTHPKQLNDLYNDKRAHTNLDTKKYIVDTHTHGPSLYTSAREYTNLDTKHKSMDTHNRGIPLSIHRHTCRKI